MHWVGNCGGFLEAVTLVKIDNSSTQMTRSTWAERAARTVDWGLENCEQ